MKEYTIYSGTEKIRSPRQLAQLSIWTAGQGILGIDRYSIKLSKSQMSSKVIKSHQFSLETSHAVSTELDSEF